MILAGAPEFILMTLVLAAGQALFTAGAWKRKIGLAVLSLFLASLVSAAQLLPSFELLGRTERSAQSAQWPLELVQLFNMPFPHFLGNDREPGHNDFWGWHLFDQKFPLYYSLYMGVGALLLFLFGLSRPWDRRQKLLLLEFFLFFLLSCGRYSPFFFLYRFIPLLSSIRYPVKFFLGSVFCISVLAAFGLDKVTETGKPGRKAVAAMAGAGVAGLALFLLFKRPVIDVLNKLFVIDKEASFREFGRSIGTGFALLAVYALIFFIVSRSKGPTRVLGGVLILLAVIDPAFHNRYVNPTVPASFYDRPPLPGGLTTPLTVYRDELYTPFLKETMGDNVRLLGFFRKSLYPFTGIGDGVRYVFNWDFYGTYSRRYLDLREAIKSASAREPAQDPEIRRLCGVSGLRAVLLRRKRPKRSGSRASMSGWNGSPKRPHRRTSLSGRRKRPRTRTGSGSSPPKRSTRSRRSSRRAGSLSRKGPGARRPGASLSAGKPKARERIP